MLAGPNVLVILMIALFFLVAVELLNLVEASEGDSKLIKTFEDAAEVWRMSRGQY